MIRSGRDQDTECLLPGERVARFAAFERAARRTPRLPDAAVRLEHPGVPPDNLLEALKGDGSGQLGIRINAQRRVCSARERRPREVS